MDYFYVKRLLIEELARQENVLDSRLYRLSRAKTPDSPGAIVDFKLAEQTRSRVAELNQVLDLLDGHS